MMDEAIGPDGFGCDCPACVQLRTAKLHVRGTVTGLQAALDEQDRTRLWSMVLVVATAELRARNVDRDKVHYAIEEAIEMEDEARERGHSLATTPVMGTA